jgi:hypothetical protein
VGRRAARDGSCDRVTLQSNHTQVAGAVRAASRAQQGAIPIRIV